MSGYCIGPADDGSSARTDSRGPENPKSDYSNYNRQPEESDMVSNNKEASVPGCVQVVIILLFKAFSIIVSLIAVLLLAGIIADLIKIHELAGVPLFSLFIWLCQSPLGKSFPTISGIVQFAMVAMVIGTYRKLSIILCLLLGSLIFYLLLNYIYERCLAFSLTLLKRTNPNIFDRF